jgi:hypothetical protein
VRQGEHVEADFRNDDCEPCEADAPPCRYGEPRSRPDARDDDLAVLETEQLQDRE